MNTNKMKSAWLSALMVSLAWGWTATAQQSNKIQAVRAGDMDDPRINESSGLAFSRRGQNILWTHNDSGDGPNLYALDTSGHLRGFYVVSGAQAYDWEDIASCVLDGSSYLVAADTGDNDEKRESYDLFWIAEPEVPDVGPVVTGTLAVAHHVQFVYEDGPHDAEAIAVAEDGRTVYVISKVGKSRLPAQVYELTLPTTPWLGMLVAKAVAPVNIPKVVGMDFSPDGKRAIVLTYEDAYEFDRANDQTWRDVFFSPPTQLPMPWRSQGESICYGPDSLTLYLTSENLPAPLWRIDRIGPANDATPPDAEQGAPPVTPE